MRRFIYSREITAKNPNNLPGSSGERRSTGSIIPCPEALIYELMKRYDMEVSMEPRKGAPLVQRAKGLLAALMGQLVTRKFWGDLFSQVIRDMAFSLMASFGDSLLRFAKTKAIAAGSAVNTTNTAGSPASSAFSQGYAPTPTYHPPSAVNGVPTYPGLGVR